MDELISAIPTRTDAEKQEIVFNVAKRVIAQDPLGLNSHLYMTIHD